jgi:hypothetical protein
MRQNVSQIGNPDSHGEKVLRLEWKARTLLAPRQ